MSNQIEKQGGAGRDSLQGTTRLSTERYYRMLPDVEGLREKAYGVAFGPDAMKGSSSTFWVEKVPDGYEVSLSVLDVASGQTERFEEVGKSLKTMTITTTLDRELQATGFRLGFTNCHLLAVIRDGQIEEILKDESSDLYPLATSYLEIAMRLQEERELDGAVDSLYAFAKRITRGQSIAAGEIIKEEFLHLAKRSVAAKLDQEGKVVLYENWPKSEDGIDMLVIQALGRQLRREPALDTAEKLLQLLKTGVGKRFVGLESFGHILQNKDAHFRFVTPGHDLESYVNAIILHGIITGENPYTTEDLQALADYLNTGKKIISPIKRAILDKKTTEGSSRRNNYMSAVREKVKKLGLDGLSLVQIPHTFNNPFKVRLEVNTPTGKKIIIGSGATYEEATSKASEAMFVELQWLG